MGTMKKKFTEEEIRKEQEEKKIPQHIIDEDLADRARERTRELKQMEMYDDEMWNWSGLR